MKEKHKRREYPPLGGLALLGAMVQFWIAKRRNAYNIQLERNGD